MESEILQRIKQEIEKEKLPDLDSMSTDELKKYIINRFPIKERLKLLINCIYLAVQQSYKDSADDDLDGYHRFSLVEGTIKWREEENIYLFSPNDSVKKLLSDVDKKDTTKLKAFLGTKFYKIIEYLYNREIRGYEEAQQKLEKIPPKVLELAMEEERRTWEIKYRKKSSRLQEELNKKDEEIKLLNEDKDQLNEMVDQLQEKLNLYNTLYGKL